MPPGLGRAAGVPTRALSPRKKQQFLRLMSPGAEVPSALLCAQGVVVLDGHPQAPEVAPEVPDAGTRQHPRFASRLCRDFGDCSL